MLAAGLPIDAQTGLVVMIPSVGGPFALAAHA